MGYGGNIEKNSMMVHKIIAIIILFTFLFLMLTTKKSRNELYVHFILLIYPFLSIDLFPSYFSVRIFDILTIIFYIFFHQNIIVSFKMSRIHQTIIYLFLFILISTLVRVFVYSDFSQSLGIMILQISCLLIFSRIIYELFTSNNQSINKVQKILSFILIFSFLFLLIQFIIGISFTISKSPNVNVEGGTVLRYPSFFQDPQKYGQFLAAVSLFTLLSFNSSKLSFLKLILFIFSGTALLYTGARAPLGGWILALILFILFIPIDRKYYLLPFFILIPVFLIEYYHIIPVFNRASMDDSYSFRNDIWRIAYSIFEEHPLSGIGLGNYQTYVEYFHSDQYWIVDNDITFYDHPESGYLKLLVEMGIVGFIPLVLIILFVLISGILQYLRFNNINSAFFTLSFLSWVIGFTTVYSLGDVRIMVLIIIISTAIISFSSRNTTYSTI